MIIIKCIKHPIIAFRLLFYYIFGRVFGRFLFPQLDFKSRWFERPASWGWKWIWRGFVWQKIMGVNRNIPWPISNQVLVSYPENIHFHIDDLNNFQTMGNYFQSFANIIIGKGCYIAPNVGLITQNHDFINLDKRAEAKDIILGKECWIGMNSIILPGVQLGDKTIVGAGSVVTKSFVEGNCVIAGNPAKIIKYI